MKMNIVIIVLKNEIKSKSCFWLMKYITATIWQCEVSTSADNANEWIETANKMCTSYIALEQHAVI